MILMKLEETGKDDETGENDENDDNWEKGKIGKGVREESGKGEMVKKQQTEIGKRDDRKGGNTKRGEKKGKSLKGRNGKEEGIIRN